MNFQIKRQVLDGSMYRFKVVPISDPTPAPFPWRLAVRRGDKTFVLLMCNSHNRSGWKSDAGCPIPGDCTFESADERVCLSVGEWDAFDSMEEHDADLGWAPSRR